MYCNSHMDLPAENTKDQVEHEEASHHDQRNEKDPIEGASYGIVGLKIEQQGQAFKANSLGFLSKP